MTTTYLINMDQDDVRAILARNIRNRRKELGMTQSKLAELADISEPYMNDIERRQTWVSDKTLAKLSWALNVELHELFVQDDEIVKSAKTAKKTAAKKKAYLLFQQRKQKMLNHIEKSLEILFRDMTKP